MKPEVEEHARAIRVQAVIAGAVIVALAAGPASAHSSSGSTVGMAAGLLHPVTGLDHLLAMVSVGVWGAELGGSAIWVLPIAFPLIMAVGGVLGVVGLPFPATETLVALSVLVLGMLVAGAWRVPVAAALCVVGVFALAHGYAHGTELPASADALAFTVGFVVATGLLHLAGIVIGSASRWRSGLIAIRVSGILIAIVGCYLLYGNGTI